METSPLPTFFICTLDLVRGLEEWEPIELEISVSGFQAGEAFGQERGDWSFGGFFAARFVFYYSITDDGTDTLAFVHQVECRIDLFQTQGVGNQFINSDISLHVLIDEAWKLGAASYATKC